MNIDGMILCHAFVYLGHPNSSYLLIKQSLADGLGSPRDGPGFTGFSHCDKSTSEKKVSVNLPELGPELVHELVAMMWN